MMKKMKFLYLTLSANNIVDDMEKQLCKK